jgi:RHS repeat-associated protein
VSASAGPPDVSIDSNGNLSQKVEGGISWTYVWDAENRLKWVCNTTPCTEAGAVAAFKYDPLGRRVEKVAGGVTTTYTYDRLEILRELAGASTLKYIHAVDVDEPIAQQDGTGTLTYLHADGLGSVVKATNPAGAVIATRRYDAFGNLELGTSNGYAFTGREWDSETGLYYYRARYYLPSIGRFLSEDPSGRQDGPNLYQYALSNPVRYSDPMGLFTIDPSCFNDCSTGGGPGPDIGEQVQKQCRNLSMITCPNLRSCLEQRCKTGHIDCRTDCVQRTGNPQAVGWAVVGRGTTANICPTFFPPAWQQNANGGFGFATIHEWSHTCGWKDGGGCGVTWQ